MGIWGGKNKAELDNTQKVPSFGTDVTNKKRKIILKRLRYVGSLVGTLQEINISHLAKRKIIFKMDFSGGYVNSLVGNTSLIVLCTCLRCRRVCRCRVGLLLWRWRCWRRRWWCCRGWCWRRWWLWFCRPRKLEKSQHVQPPTFSLSHMFNVWYIWYIYLTYLHLGIV